ncbi:hypothetical protein AB4144_05120 [Rhizobiaceae sp. 2RAB30]
MAKNFMTPDYVNRASFATWAGMTEQPWSRGFLPTTTLRAGLNLCA